jgi:hypothetical protein
VKKQAETEADFEVDKLTNSIENTITGEVFDTEITRLYSKDTRQIKKKDWVFEWNNEFKDPTNEVYKLTTINNPTIIQGLICFSDKHDHIFMSLIESAKFNKGSNKLYRGVAGNLVAFGSSNRMFIDTKAALVLVKQYFKNFNHGKF